MEMQTLIGWIGLLGGGITVWVMMNNRVTRGETEIVNLKHELAEHKENTMRSISDMREELRADIHQVSQDVKQILMKMNNN